MTRDDPPAQGALFRLPPEGFWVYKIEYRFWQRYLNGREEWSEWSPLTNSRLRLKSWYTREGDAQRALARYQRDAIIWSRAAREFRIQPHWSEFKPER